VDFQVVRAGRASLGYQVGGDIAPAALHRGRDREQRLQLGRHGGVVRVGADLLDQGHAAGQLGRGGGRMRGRAVPALVQRRHVCCD